MQRVLIYIEMKQTVYHLTFMFLLIAVNKSTFKQWFKQKRSTESLNKEGILTQSTFVWNSVRQLQRLESLPLNHWYLCSEIIHTKTRSLERELEFQMKDSISEKMEGQYRVSVTETSFLVVVFYHNLALNLS